MRRQGMWANAERRESTAGMAAFIGNPIPIASTTLAIVEAVPIVMQWPAERLMQLSASWKSHKGIAPLRTSSLNFQTLVPDPICSPRNLPLSIGPRSEEHTSELQSRENLVCRLL